MYKNQSEIIYIYPMKECIILWRERGVSYSVSLWVVKFEKRNSKWWSWYSLQGSSFRTLKLMASIGLDSISNEAGQWALKGFMKCSAQFSSVAQSCLSLCDPMNCNTPGLPVHHQLPEFTQIHVHWVDDAIQLSHPLSSPSLPAPNPSQHQGLFQWVSSSHEVAKVLEFQL